MTSRRNLKKRVRALQKVSGERYTSALARVKREKASAARRDPEPEGGAAKRAFDKVLKGAIAYRTDAMNHTATRRNLVYRKEGRRKLLMDVQLPPNLPARARLPAVFFIHGGPLPEEGTPPKQWGMFKSYAALAAASGMVGVTFNHRFHGPTDHLQSRADIAEAVAFVRANAADLRVDAERIALWYFSGSGPQMSWVLQERPAYVRCVLAFYALLDLRHLAPPGASAEVLQRIEAFSPAALVKKQARGLPMFIARAGLDSPMINRSIDAFVSEALAGNSALELLNHPEGQHTFDVLDDVPRTREIIARAITFIQAHVR